MGRIANILIPFQKILIKLGDFFQKIKGIMAASVYTLYSFYLTMKSMLGAFIQIVIGILVIVAVAIIALWILGFFFAPALVTAAISTTLFVIIATLLTIMIIFLENNLHISGNYTVPGIPSRPSCFDKNTVLTMNNGEKKRIVDVEVGDILWNNNKITAKLLLDARGNKMYTYYDERQNPFLVSGKHRVMFGGRWIYVEDDPRVSVLNKYDEPYLYCLCTENKCIDIGTYTFCDWDEVFEEELAQLKMKTKIEGPEQIHTRLYTGFNQKEQLRMIHGSAMKEMKDICVGDMLVGGIRVIGLVEFMGPGPRPGEHRIDTDRTLEKDKLCHLLTNVGYFFVNGKIEKDFNFCVEKYL
jgi:hypothetical protein